MVENIERLEEITNILKSLAHPIRFQIVSLLSHDDEIPVTLISESLCSKQPIISQQLRILRMNKMVRVVRKKGFSYYSLAMPKLKELIECMESCVQL